MSAPSLQSQDGEEEALRGFLATLPPALTVRMRTLAHAWQGGGGHLQVGRVAVRLLGQDPQGRAFTAGSLHAHFGPRGEPSLELARVLLRSHGVGEAAWREWCDERAELRDAGFDPEAKFPAVRLYGLEEGVLARLALGLRDLALLSSGRRTPLAGEAAGAAAGTDREA